jgi:hypothetical protein
MGLRPVVVYPRTLVPSRKYFPSQSIQPERNKQLIARRSGGEHDNGNKRIPLIWLQARHYLPTYGGAG